MSVRIRLLRVGKRSHPHYRVVAIDRRLATGASPLEVLGHYHPRLEGKEKIHIDFSRYQYWLKCGAQPTVTVRTMVSTIEDKVSEHGATSEPSGA